MLLGFVALVTYLITDNSERAVEASYEPKPAQILEPPRQTDVSLPESRKETALKSNWFSQSDKYAECDKTLLKIANTHRFIYSGNIELPQPLIEKHGVEAIIQSIYALGLDPTRFRGRTHFKKSESDEAIGIRDFVGFSVPDSKPLRKIVKIMQEHARLNSHSNRQKRGLLKDGTVTNASDISQILKQAIDNVDDINQRFNFDSRNFNTTLLEMAIVNNNFEIVNYLLDSGAIPKNTYTHPNPLELAVINSDIEHFPEQVRQYVKRLLAYNLPIRFTELQDQVIGFYQPIKISDFSEERIRFFLSLGYDITKTKDVAYFQSIDDDRVTYQLKEYLNRLKFEENGTTLEDAQECSDFTKTIHSMLKRNNVELTILNADDNSNSVLQYLHDLEPGLVDAYRLVKLKTQPIERPQHLSFSSLDSEELLIEGKYEAFEALLVKNQEKKRPIDLHDVFNKVAKESSSGIDYLIRQGYAPIEIDFIYAGSYAPDVIELLIERQYLPNKTNELGRSLVHYAALHCNLPLLEYLLNNGTPYHPDKYGVDPLGKVLRMASQSEVCFIPSVDRNKGINSPNTAEVVKYLMRFDPEIKDYHRSRLAELKLLSIHRYRKVIEAVPELANITLLEPRGYYFESGDMVKGVPIWY